MDQTVVSYFSEFGIILMIVCLMALVFYIWSVVWAYQDARRRGKSGLLVALMVLLMVWPVGLLLWLALRPQVAQEQA
ncbi:hypothetical protein H9Q13_04830 [Pontibacter sp. JH31]|uniref:Cardiolipin synthase N-terminal domain-containing protein n=1 Tax=Pontibacter aquaedesilientis TaxID=2766980 RepID=A0ABR7XDX0_9BACT|nr:hypothetical protein [Pontibacter aquaedesilientis]MBD1396480.1 hypothetical protein [Pontibacter aquaedesilientis]